MIIFIIIVIKLGICELCVNNFGKFFIIICIFINMIMNDISNVEIFLDFKCLYGWFWLVGLIEILSLMIIVIEIKMFVMLFKVFVLIVVEL